MSTTAEQTPQTPIVIPNWVHAWGVFVKHHERIILVGIGALVIWHFGDKAYDGWRLGRDTTAQAQINQQIEAIHAQNQATQAVLAQMQQNFNTTVETLNAAIAKKQQVTIIQQQKDAVMPPVELSQRWETLVSAPEGSIAPTTDGKIAVSIDAAHTTVNELEKVPQLTEQVLDTQTELKSCVQLSAQKDATIEGVKQELTTEKKGREADAKGAADELSKAKKKSFWKGFKTGAGVVGGVVVAATVAFFIH